MDKDSKSKKTEKIILIALLVIIGLAGGLIFAINIMMYVQTSNAMKWTPDETITKEDKIRYANIVMIPKVTDYIDKVSLRGIRDPEYCIETVSFNSIEELYSILPFESDKDREEAIEDINDAITEVPDIPKENNEMTAYYANILPITDEDSQGKVVSYYYIHKNYIIKSLDGYRLVFIVQTT